MVGRPPLPIGAYGNINTKVISEPGTKPVIWQAQCRFRDIDGRTPQIKRTAPTKTAAENAVKKALAERTPTSGRGAGLTNQSRVHEAAALWFEHMEAARDDGSVTSNTVELYRISWRLYVEPAMGQLRLYEATVQRCDAWKIALRKRHGVATVKTARAVLTGILGHAARLGALDVNPARDMSRVSGRRKRKPRSMTAVERTLWLERLEASERARVWDLPDLTRFMLATGVRIGEALAVSWDEIDLAAETVRIEWKIVYVRGEGLQRQPGTKTEGGDRLLKLPVWAVAMLRARLLAAQSYALFPDSYGGWRDPSNVQRVIRELRGEDFAWLTTHVWRQTVITFLDEAGLKTRKVSDQVGHSKIEQTMEYMERKVASEEAARALDAMF